MSSTINTSSITSSTTDIEPPNFRSVMRETYPNAVTFIPPGSKKRKTKGRAVYDCILCPGWAKEGRYNAYYHVRSYHPHAPTFSGSLITDSFPSYPSDDGLRRSFNLQAYRDAIIGLLTRRRMPFSAVEWPEMRQLALACNPAIEGLLITSRRQAVRYMTAHYNQYSDQIQDSLQMATSPIHLSCDLWTSPHRHSLFAICAQWVDHDYQLQKALLGLPECRLDHSGRHQADLILRVLEGFKITSRIGWVTGDNATSNDTCLELLQSRLLKEHNVGLQPFLRLLANT